MSWSCNVKGTKEAVKAHVEESLDNSAKIYDGYSTTEGKQEAQDCRDVKRAILDAVEGITLDADSYATDGYVASVAAWGSRSVGTVTINVTVTKEKK